MNTAHRRTPTEPVLKACAVRLAADGDTPVVSPVAAHLQRIEAQLRGSGDAVQDKYPRRVRALALIGGATASWGILIAAVAMASHVLIRQ